MILNKNNRRLGMAHNQPLHYTTGCGEALTLSQPHAFRNTREEDGDKEERKEEHEEEREWPRAKRLHVS